MPPFLFSSALGRRVLSFKYLKMQTTATPGTRGFNVPEQKGHASWNIFFFISKHAPDHVNPFRPSQVISIDLTGKKLIFFKKKKRRDTCGRPDGGFYSAGNPSAPRGPFFSFFFQLHRHANEPVVGLDLPPPIT